MSHIEKITGEFRALMTGIERAQGLAAAADSQAQEVILRAAGAGFGAVDPVPPATLRPLRLESS